MARFLWGVTRPRHHITIVEQYNDYGCDSGDNYYDNSDGDCYYETVTVTEDDMGELELEEMVSYRKNVTGISHTVFISPRGNAAHGPRVKTPTLRSRLQPITS